MPRPYWKGYLKLALVSCPIAVYTATSESERIAFKQINRSTGNRLRQQLVDDATRQPVEAADKARGYEIDKDTYILIEDDEIDSIAVESSHTIDIDAFVPRAEIDERYLDSPYYIAPNDKVGAEAFAVIREAMRGKAVVALGRVVLAKRERVMMLQPWENGLLGVTLRYPYEVRETASYFEGIPEVKVDKELLSLADHLIRSKAAAFDPSKFHDRFEDALVQMLDKKRAGIPESPTRSATPQRTVVDIMEALRNSLAQEPANDSAPKKAIKPKRKAPAGQTEMLLPIEGKGKPKAAEAAKPAAVPAGKRKAG